MPEVQITIFDVGILDPARTIAASAIIQELAQHPGWPIFVALVQQVKVTQALNGYVDSEHSKNYYAGLIQGLDFAQSLPASVKAEAEAYSKIADERRAAMADRSGDGELS